MMRPEFDETRSAWAHYWEGELYLKRPLVVASCAKPGAAPLTENDDPHAWSYYRELTGEWDEQLRRIDRCLESTEWLCETIPFFGPDFGPDQFAAFCGAELQFSDPSAGTNWVEPIVKDWSEFEIVFDPSNTTWQRLLEYSRKLAAHSDGRYAVGVCDLHSNGDTLSALRNPASLCMDFYDAPDQVIARMQEVRRLYQPVYNGLYEAGGMAEQGGSIGWIPFWCDGRFATIQCDFICMVSPELGREYIIPALEEEAAFLDRCVYHLDGPGALPHLDDILAIDDIDAIQWVSGAGQKKMWQWLDVLKKCQAAGKGLVIEDITTEEAKTVHPELDPVGVVYRPGGERDEILEFSDWLVENT